MAALGPEPLWVRDPLGPRVRPLPLPPGGGSVLCLRRDRARELVSAGRAGGRRRRGALRSPEALRFRCRRRCPGPAALRPLRHPRTGRRDARPCTPCCRLAEQEGLL